MMLPCQGPLGYVGCQDTPSQHPRMWVLVQWSELWLVCALVCANTLSYFPVSGCAAGLFTLLYTARVPLLPCGRIIEVFQALTTHH